MAIASLEKRPPVTLPRAIRRGLARVDHRLRAVGAARGLGKALLLLTVGAAVAMAARRGLCPADVGSLGNLGHVDRGGDSRAAQGRRASTWCVA